MIHLVSRLQLLILSEGKKEKEVARIKHTEAGLKSARRQHRAADTPASKTSWKYRIQPALPSGARGLNGIGGHAHINQCDGPIRLGIRVFNKVPLQRDVGDRRQKIPIWLSTRLDARNPETNEVPLAQA